MEPRMKRNLIHPSLLSMDNAMEEFWREYRQKTANVEVIDEYPEWAGSHIRANFPDREEAEFISMVNAMAKPKPWKMNLFLGVSLYFWVMYEIGRRLGAW
jgi:hypothetical protein